MKKMLLVCFCFSINLIVSQKINVRDYAATGNGLQDDTEAFNKAIKYAKAKFSANQKPSIIYIPNGTYLISGTIELDKYISIEGEFVNTTVLRTKSRNSPVISLVKNFNESEIYNSYNYVINLTLQGPDVENSFVGVKNISKTETGSVGILIKGLRTRLSDLQIEGFLNSGIEVNGTYYTFIEKSFLKNNATGLLITNTSTSVYLTQSEVRFNSIGILINNNSFANFISKNMIESNVATFNPIDTSTKQINTKSTGRGIVISNAAANIITENYLENHFVNFTIEDSRKNIIKNNFYAIGNSTVTTAKNQVSLQMIGNSLENIFESNTFLTSDPSLEANSMIIGDGNYSTNRIDVGIDNKKLKSLINSVQKTSTNHPQIPN